MAVNHWRKLGNSLRVVALSYDTATVEAIGRWTVAFFFVYTFGSSAAQAEVTEPFLQMRIAWQLPNADPLAALVHIPALGGLKSPQLRL